MPKSGSSEPEGQPAQRNNQPAKGNFRSGRQKNELAQQPLRSGACRKTEAVNPKANPPRAISEAEGGKTNPTSGRTSPPRATPKRCVPKSGSRESEGQPAEATPKRCVPKSGSSEPEGQPAQRKNQPAEGYFQSGRRKNELAQRPLRSGAGRKAEAVSPKANPPRAISEAVRAEKRKQ